MRITTLIFLAIGLTTGLEDCPGGVSTKCGDYKDLTTVGFAGYGCSKTISANCLDLEEKRDTILSAMDEWVSTGVCNVDAINRAGETIAKSVAGFFSHALGSVVCEGQSYFCGWTVAGLEDWISRTEEDLAMTTYLGGMGSFPKKFCYGDLREISQKIKDKIDSVKDLTCTIGGGPEDFTESLTSSLAQVIQGALFRATAADCGFTAESVCSDPEETIAAGDECGGTSDVSVCTGTLPKACCLDNFPRTLCFCARCDGPWRKQSSTESDFRVFISRSGKKCYCPRETESVARAPISAVN